MKKSKKIKGQSQKAEHGSFQQSSQLIDPTHNKRQQSLSTFSQKNPKPKKIRMNTQYDLTNTNIINQQLKRTQSVQPNNIKQKKVINQQATLHNRMKTDLTSKTEKQSLLLHRKHNNAIQQCNDCQEFHEKYDLDQEEFSVIVRMETEKLQLFKSLQQKILEGHHKDCISIQNSSINVGQWTIKQKNGEKLSDDSYNLRQSQKLYLKLEKNQQNQSQPSNSFVTEASDKKKLSVQQQQSKIKASSIGQEEQQKSINKSAHTMLCKSPPSIASQQCSIGPLITVYEEQTVGKPLIKCFSQGNKIGTNNPNKYLPKTQEQRRMQQRCIQFQRNALSQIKQTQQLLKLGQKYQNNRKIISQRSNIKFENNKVIQNARYQLKQFQQGNNKSLSLPRLPMHFEVDIPCPNYKGAVESPQELELKKIEKNYKNLQGSLSANRFLYLQKKQSLSKKIKNMQQHNLKELENLRRIENMLRSKGIAFNKTELRKNCIIINSMPNIENGGRLQLPKTLVSNPRYQKYPL